MSWKERSCSSHSLASQFRFDDVENSCRQKDQDSIQAGILQDLCMMSVVLSEQSVRTVPASCNNALALMTLQHDRYQLLIKAAPRFQMCMLD